MGEDNQKFSFQNWSNMLNRCWELHCHCSKTRVRVPLRPLIICLMQYCIILWTRVRLPPPAPRGGTTSGCKLSGNSSPEKAWSNWFQDPTFGKRMIIIQAVLIWCFLCLFINWHVGCLTIASSCVSRAS